MKSSPSKDLRYHLAKSTLLVAELPFFGNMTGVDVAIAFFDKFNDGDVEYLINRQESLWPYLKGIIGNDIDQAKNSLAVRALTSVEPLELGEAFIEAIGTKRPDIAIKLTPQWVAMNFVQILQGNGDT